MIPGVNLLSRINGDAPAHIYHALDVWIVREWACLTVRSRSCTRASEPGPSTTTVTPKPTIRSFFFLPLRGKVNLNVYKTLCWKPRFPNDQRRSAGIVFPGRNR